MKAKWAQFGINGTLATAQAWRTRTIPADPLVGASNVTGTVAFAFATKNGRSTQAFLNLVDTASRTTRSRSSCSAASSRDSR